MGLQGRKILITGSSSGIGRAISECFLREGATVIGLARDHSKFCPKTPKYKTYTLDIHNIELISSCLKVVVSENPGLDGLVSNAGYGSFDMLENFSLKQISNYITANLVSHMAITREVIPYFKTNKRGDIVFIGSESALKGAKKGSLYAAAKFGLRGFMQAIRDECANRNIRVSIINPGMVKTPFFDALDFKPGSEPCNVIEPTDVAQAALSILSARAETVIDEINMSPLNQVIKFT